MTIWAGDPPHKLRIFHSHVIFFSQCALNGVKLVPTRRPTNYQLLLYWSLVNSRFAPSAIDSDSLSKGKTQQCFALLPQVNFPTNNLNFHWRWRWWDRIQAIFLNLFYFKRKKMKNLNNLYLVPLSDELEKKKLQHEDFY